MADEISTRVNSGNGESIEVNLQEKRVSMLTKSLIPALAIIGAFAILYLVVGELVTQLTGGQAVGHATLAQILQVINSQHQEKMAAGQVQHQTAMAAIQETRHHTDAQTAELRKELLAQNTLGQEATKELSAATREQTKELSLLAREQLTLMRHWFAVVLHKLHYPDAPVSLDLPVPSEKGSRQEGY